MRWGSQASITMTLFWFVVASYYQTLSLGDIISNLLHVQELHFNSILLDQAMAQRVSSYEV